ncbi:hypothetical protein NQ176_g4820 [Zarea fungicola]|uniref:Uncharacterized protein n=1 Tax=Zarea fungicola TaxID=93591 RepID=A0ACC1NCF6_9HYPO|nr:hypothetical protein NQ176_g4820 [Lecanicillium fungicola]
MCQATRIYINHTVCGHRSKNPVLRVGPPCPISLAAGVGEVYCPLPELKWQDKEAESPEPCSICHDTKLWYLIINQDGVRKKWVPLISATDAVMHNKTSLNAMEIESSVESVGELEALEEIEETELMEEQESTELEDLEQRGEDVWQDWRNDEEEVLEEDRGDPPPPYSE